MKNPTYLRMILTSVIMFLGMIINSWGVRFILIVGVIVLIILQFKYDKQLYDKCQLIDDAEVCKKEAEKLREEYNNKIHSVDEKTKSIIEDCKKEIKTIANEANKKATKLDAEINKLQEEYNKLNGEYMYEVSKFIISDNITSEEYKSKYNLSVLREKDIIKDGRAVNIDLYDKLELKKQIENDAKQLLRCFNSETASILLALTVKNIDSSKNKIMRCFETLNKLFSTDKVSLSKEILEIKLEQADLMYAYQYQKEQERLQQKAIREQMVEEEVRV